MAINWVICGSRASLPESIPNDHASILSGGAFGQGHAGRRSAALVAGSYCYSVYGVRGQAGFAQAIAKKTSDQKKVVLDINQRRAELIDLEKQTLNAENQRRTATGLAPYANWESYQASIDALVESRAKMKAHLRPPLPEEETFITEAANVLIDYAKLQSH